MPILLVTPTPLNPPLLIHSLNSIINSEIYVSPQWESSSCALSCATGWPTQRINSFTGNIEMQSFFYSHSRAKHHHSMWNFMFPSSQYFSTDIRQRLESWDICELSGDKKNSPFSAEFSRQFVSNSRNIIKLLHHFDQTDFHTVLFWEIYPPTKGFIVRSSAVLNQKGHFHDTGNFYLMIFLWILPKTKINSPAKPTLTTIFKECSTEKYF